MATLTVPGASGSTVSLSFDTQQNYLLAQQIAAALTAAVDAGTVKPVDSANGPPPPVPAGKLGQFVASTNGTTVLPPGYTYVVDDAANATIFSSGDKDQQVLSSDGNLNFIAAAGNGTLVGGGGNNQVQLLGSDTGGWQINLGNGNDTIRALGPGNDTLAAGGGNNFIQLGAGNDLIISAGADTIFAGSGSETVAADASSSSSSDVIYGNASRLFLFAGGGATVFGGSGSDTVFGGSGPDLLQGGTAGNNFLQAGSGPASLYGGGSGDQLYAAGSAPQALHAGSGNETLVGAFASGKDTFFGGSGNDQIFGGAGQNTFVFGTGNATITATPTSFTELFQAIKGQAGGADSVQGLTDASQLNIKLTGYGPNEAADALAGQTTNGSSVTVTLSDNTKITFANITQLTSSNFS